jgi:hypothetical protein
VTPRPARQRSACARSSGETSDLRRHGSGWASIRSGDPSITDEFAAEPVAIDARESHTYSVCWTSHDVAFYVDDRLVKAVRQSPAYPMQFMLDIYEFADGPDPPSAPERYPKIFAVEWFRGYRPVVGPDSRPSAFHR